MNQTTPTSINVEVLKFCKEIDPTTTPIFVNVIPIKDPIYNECYGNVDNHVKKNGGRIEYGWIIWEDPKIYLEAEFHAVWVDNEGKYIDITPKKDEEEKILFLKDSVRKFTGEPIDNIRKPLLDNAGTRTLVAVGKKRFELNKKYNRKVPLFEIENLKIFEKKVFLEEIRKDKLDGKIKIGRNEPCPCGSGKKYKKCCIVY